jgi:hypothetical protein
MTEASVHCEAIEDSDQENDHGDKEQATAAPTCILAGLEAACGRPCVLSTAERPG